MKTTIKTIHLKMILVFSVVVVMLASGSLSQANMVVVTPSSMDNWAFYSTDNGGIINLGSGVGQMVNGPGTPPLGTGSANFQTPAGQGDQSVQLRNSSWAGTRIDALTSLSYSTYATAWNGQQIPYMTIWLDTDGDGARDDRLWFEPDYSYPAQPHSALNTWQTWDALNGMWYSDSGVGGNGPGSNAITLAAYLSFKPNATIINDAGQGIGGIRLATGFASPEDNFDANVDNFTIGTAGGTTTYDFEPIPEPGTLTLLGTALLGLGVVYLRRRRARA
jgi:hypothetical protein